MPIIHLKGRQIQLTPSGYFQTMADWEPWMLPVLASRLGMRALPEHAQVVHFARDFYEHHGRLPRVNELCAGTAVSLRELYMIFPSGLSLVCRLGGLPRPACG